MGILEVNQVSFSYEGTTKQQLEEINFSVKEGDFVVLSGLSGSGKSTLLQLLCPISNVVGEYKGEVLFNGQLVQEASVFDIGYVMQESDYQLVSDKVWSELAFGLENKGVAPGEIEKRIGEIIPFFGLNHLFDKNISALSNGQKQLISVVAQVITGPKVLLLDEPTSKLDITASKEFYSLLRRLNEELGLTIIIVEHDLTLSLHLADEFIWLEAGRIKYQGTPQKVISSVFKNEDSTVERCLPSTIKVAHFLGERQSYPLTFLEGIRWLSSLDKLKIVFEASTAKLSEKTIIEVLNIDYQYNSKQPYVLEDVCLRVSEGEAFGLLGGNGSGKSTMLSVLAGIKNVKRGKVKINGVRMNNKEYDKLYGKKLAYLPQDVPNLFTEETVELDYIKYLLVFGINDLVKIKNLASKLGFTHLLDTHPDDLSMGQRQLVAFGKLCLLEADYYLLDEPTVGLDEWGKKHIVDYLLDLKKAGKTIIIASHDLDFVIKTCDRCGLMFNKHVTAIMSTRKFFRDNLIYTTEIHRLLRKKESNILTYQDLKMSEWSC